MSTSIEIKPRPSRRVEKRHSLPYDLPMDTPSLQASLNSQEISNFSSHSTSVSFSLARLAHTHMANHPANNQSPPPASPLLDRIFIYRCASRSAYPRQCRRMAFARCARPTNLNYWAPRASANRHYCKERCRCRHQRAVS